MEKDVTISARISKELAATVELLSKQYRRSKSWLVEDALKQYAVREKEFLEAVEVGKRAARRGEVVSHEEVKKAWQRRKTKLQH